jgi:hypothetical protein
VGTENRVTHAPWDVFADQAAEPLPAQNAHTAWGAGHDVDGERGDVGGAGAAADRGRRRMLRRHPQARL